MRFLIVGTTTVGIDLAVYSVLLGLGITVSLAKGVGFITGTVFAYFANRIWTFNTTGSATRFAAFLALYAGTLGVNVAVNAAVIGVLGGSPAGLGAAFLFATGCSAALNFLGMKYAVFASRRRSEAASP